MSARDWPSFSIITITYNNREGLRKTAASISSQTTADYEWIIIDGNSHDGTRNDFSRYGIAHIICEPDKGIYDAMNKGIKKAQGDYIIFMNAGDMFANNQVLETIKSYTQSRPDFIYGDAIEDNHHKKARSHKRINWGMFTHHQAMFYSREYLKYMRYRPEYKIAADYDLTMKFLRRSEHITYVPTAICVFETGGISQTHAKLGRDEQFKSRRQNKSCGLIANHMIRILQIVRYSLRQYTPRFYWRLTATR